MSSQKKKTQPFTNNISVLNAPISRSALFDKHHKLVLPALPPSQLPPPQKTLRSLVTDIERCIEQASCEIPGCLQDCMKVLHSQAAREERRIEVLRMQTQEGQEEPVNNKSSVSLRRSKIKKVASRDLFDRVRAMAEQRPSPLTLCDKAIIKQLRQQLDQKEENIKTLEGKIEELQRAVARNIEAKSDLQTQLNAKDVQIRKVMEQKAELEQQLEQEKSEPPKSSDDQCALLRQQLKARQAELLYCYQASQMAQHVYQPDTPDKDDS